MAEASAAVAKNIWAFRVRDLINLPADLAQLIVDDMVALGKLGKSSLALFGSQCLYKLNLADYPGVTNEWMALLIKPHLQIVRLSGCQQVITSYAFSSVLPAREVRVVD